MVRHRRRVLQKQLLTRGAFEIPEMTARLPFSLAPSTKPCSVSNGPPGPLIVGSGTRIVELGALATSGRPCKGGDQGRHRDCVAGIRLPGRGVSRVHAIGKQPEMIIAATCLDLDRHSGYTEQRPLLACSDVRSSQVERVFLIGFGLRHLEPYLGYPIHCDAAWTAPP